MPGNDELLWPMLLQQSKLSKLFIQLTIGADKKALVDPDRSCFSEKLSLARLRRPLSTLTSHKWRSLVWYSTVRQNRSCIIHTNTLLQRAEIYLNNVDCKLVD
ncbi:hypothetical protein T4A_5034 [Trichinella pseudospiralis]|uniref:Uncharacterized protein n=1 Tax=Trichinella pseudospiralis TaxID=6337 RepID=A0A0V0YJ09_TRIPS|nr:hypothetical protein T4E_9227 [Trichinella pseudospiralis]KRY73628.1 hypothetical protein T4A_5034 [Trichinella pseudospiralis]